MAVETALSTPAILVVADNAGDAAPIKKLLDFEFDSVFTSIDPAQATEDLNQHRPGVLVLAFNALENAENYYLGGFSQSDAMQESAHRTIILCHKDEARRAYQLCRDGFFDDYVLFRPTVPDLLRLPMAVHHALRELNAMRDSEPLPADFAQLATLETLLDKQLAQGRQFIEQAGHSVEQAVEGVDAALEEFFRRLTQGEMPDVVEVRDIEALSREIARIEKNEVRLHLRGVTESVRPLVQWGHEFRQACAPHLASARALGALVQRKPPTILVVDDDEFQHKIIGTILKNDPYRLVFASAGTEALHILRRIRPDLILMDLMLPDMDGLTVTRHIKSSPRLAGIPVIVITGKSEKNVVLDSVKLGVAGFLAKPFDRVTLRSKVEQVLRSARG